MLFVRTVLTASRAMRRSQSCSVFYSGGSQVLVVLSDAPMCAAARIQRTFTSDYTSTRMHALYASYRWLPSKRVASCSRRSYT